MDKLMKLVAFMQKRPSDKQIMIFRVWLWMLIWLLLVLSYSRWDSVSRFWLEAKYEDIIKYSFFIFAIVPIIMWIFAKKICVAKKKTVRIIQLIVWIMLIMIGNNIHPKETIQIQDNSTTIDLQSVNNKKTEKSINYWTIIALLGILPILAWATGKCITSNCMKYKEKVTKIRV